MGAIKQWEDLNSLLMINKISMMYERMSHCLIVNLMTKQMKWFGHNYKIYLLGKL